MIDRALEIESSHIVTKCVSQSPEHLQASHGCWSKPGPSHPCPCLCARHMPSRFPATARVQVGHVMLVCVLLWLTNFSVPQAHMFLTCGRSHRAAPLRCAAAPSVVSRGVMELAAASMPPPALPYRVGHGFDLHRLEEGPYKLILGGLEIPHDRGCVAHSDGERCCYVFIITRLGRQMSQEVLLQAEHSLATTIAGDALLHTVTGMTV